MCALSPAMPVQQPSVARPAGAALAPIGWHLPGPSHPWAEWWPQAAGLLPRPVQARLDLTRIPAWLEPATERRWEGLRILCPSLGHLGDLLPPLSRIETWHQVYLSDLAWLDWIQSPPQPDQDWRILVARGQSPSLVTPATPQHPAIPLPPGPAVWLVWTAATRTSDPEPVLIQCATPEAPRRGEILRVWDCRTAWERTLTVVEDTLALSDPDDPDHLGLARLLWRQGRAYTEIPPEGA